MATKHPEGHRHDDDSVERERDLGAIDDLIGQCKGRLSAVSPALLSSATKDSMTRMYREIRTEAERDDLRKERLQWMRENVSKLQETIAKAAAQRERFEADVNAAVEKKWLSRESAARWMRRFEDPGLLEMYRSAWMKEEWEGFKERWGKLANDRAAVLARAAAAGVRPADVPELHVLSKDESFLSDTLSYHERRSLVDTANAAVDAAGTGKTVELRKTEALLLPESKGAGRCVHPGKVGQWLRRAMASGNPAAFRADVIVPFLRNWRAARERYDALAERYAAEGRPDGCAPMSLNGFLEAPYDGRLAILNEWTLRLDAADRAAKGAAEALDASKADIRRAVDLKDLDVATALLEPLRAEHPADADLKSIAAHVATLRAEREKNAAKEGDERERTERALEELEAMPDGVPTVLAKHYEYLLRSGSADQAAAFFGSMKARADRRKTGKTDAHDEFLAGVAADEAEEAEVVAATPVDDGTEDAALVVTHDTPPAETIALIKAQGAANPHRAPALVVEGVAFEQHLQLVSLNERALANMRHLDSVGTPYGRRDAQEEQEEAVAA